MLELDWFQKCTGGEYNPAEMTRAEVVEMFIPWPNGPVVDWSALPDQPTGQTLGELADKIIEQAKRKEHEK